VGIKEENINITIQSIKKDSEEEMVFIGSITRNIKLINASDLKSQEDIQRCVIQLAMAFEKAWSTHSTTKHITKHSKEWWNKNCTDCLTVYHKLGDIQSWKVFKVAIREAKRKIL